MDSNSLPERLSIAIAPVKLLNINARILQIIKGISVFSALFFKNTSVVYFERYSISVAPDSMKNTGTAQYAATSTIKLCFHAVVLLKECTIPLQCIATTAKLAIILSKSKYMTLFFIISFLFGAAYFFFILSINLLYASSRAILGFHPSA